MLKIINAISVVLGLVVVILGGFFFLDGLHATKVALLNTEVEIRQEILDTNINRDAKIRYHYDQLESERPLNKAEKSRKEYVEEELERQYHQQRMLEEKQLELEN